MAQERSVSPEPSYQGPQLPAPDPELKRLDFLVGTWKIEGENKEWEFGPAGKVTSIDTFEWLEGGYFLVHRWETTFSAAGQDTVDNGYEFFGYDAASKKYRTHFFNSYGPYDEAGNTYEGGFVDDSLILTGPNRITYKLNEDGTITNDADLPGENSTWIPWMHTTMTRIR